MNEVIYILQTNSSIEGEWIDTSYKYKTRVQAKIGLMSSRKTASEINITSIFRIIKQTRQALYEDES